MEDRYLFKAKHSLYSKEWHIGNLVKEPDGLYIKEVDKNRMVYIQDRSIICQCTGLKDKNGKLIWENDIVDVQYGKAIVVWEDSDWRLEWIDTDTIIWYRRDLPYWAKASIDGVEVIGNKFDTPKLMEV